MRVNAIMQKDVTTLGVEENLDIADDIMTLGRLRHLTAQPFLRGARL